MGLYHRGPAALSGSRLACRYVGGAVHPDAGTRGALPEYGWWEKDESDARAARIVAVWFVGTMQRVYRRSGLSPTIPAHDSGMLRFLTIIPVHNEEKYIEPVLRQVRCYAPDVLVVDDGSTDGTPDQLARFPDIAVVRHARNEGYGAALRTGFQYAVEKGYDVAVTMDCDGQHQPSLIPRLLRALPEADIVSGSRYLVPPPRDARIPSDRRRINVLITDLLNRLFNWQLTDAFCGFKAYRRDVLERLVVTEPGYAMPLEVWVQAACHGWRIREVPVPVIYLDDSRAFGGALDDPNKRLNHYLNVLRSAVEQWLPESLERLPDVEVVFE